MAKIIPNILKISWINTHWNMQVLGLPGNPLASLTEFIQFASTGIPKAGPRCLDVFVNTAGMQLRHILRTPFGIRKCYLDVKSFSK